GRLSTSCNPTCSELNWPRSGLGFVTMNAALAFTTGASCAAFVPATTITRSVSGCSARIAAERNVPPRQGSRALSRPMRVDAPADKTTPAKEGARAMLDTYNYNLFTPHDFVLEKHPCSLSS